MLPLLSTICVIESIQYCANASKDWAVQNKLQLNEDNTEALLVASSSPDELPTSIQIGPRVVPFYKTIRNLGVTLY